MYGSRPPAPTPTRTLLGRGTESTAQRFSCTHATSSHTHMYCMYRRTVDETTTAACVPPAVLPRPTLERRGRWHSGGEEGDLRSLCINTGQQFNPVTNQFKLMRNIYALKLRNYFLVLLAGGGGHFFSISHNWVKSPQLCRLCLVFADKTE